MPTGWEPFFRKIPWLMCVFLLCWGNPSSGEPSTTCRYAPIKGIFGKLMADFNHDTSLVSWNASHHKNLEALKTCEDRVLALSGIETLCTDPNRAARTLARFSKNDRECTAPVTDLDASTWETLSHAVDACFEKFYSWNAPASYRIDQGYYTPRAEDSNAGALIVPWGDESVAVRDCIVRNLTSTTKKYLESRWNSTASFESSFSQHLEYEACVHPDELVNEPANASKTCPTTDVCNWAPWITTNEGTCGENPWNPGTGHFCGECHGPSCLEVSLPESRYTWVQSEEECALMDGVRGPWGPWHCVLPVDARVDNKYCSHSGLYEEHCGGVCVVPSVSTKGECETLNNRQIEWVRQTLRTDSVSVFASSYECSIIMQDLQKEIYQTMKEDLLNGFPSHPPQGFQTSIENKLQRVASSISEAATRCSTLLKEEIGPIMTRMRTALKAQRRQEEGGETDPLLSFEGDAWNTYHWEAEAGYCQVGNLGPEDCNGDSSPWGKRIEPVEWIPHMIHQRGMFDTEEKCKQGRCYGSPDACTACTQPCAKCRSSAFDQGCESLSLEMCALCEEGDAACSVESNLGCYVNRLDTCDTEEECTGVWTSDTRIALEWTTRRMVPVNRWELRLNKTEFQEEIEGIVGDLKSQALRQELECKYALVSADVESLVCNCIDKTSCNLDASLVASMGETEVYHGLKRQISWGRGAAVVTVSKDSFLPNTLSRARGSKNKLQTTLGVKVVTDLDTLLDRSLMARHTLYNTMEWKEEGKRRQRNNQIMWHRSSYREYAVVQNEIGGLVGQLVGTGYSINFDSSVTAHLRVCLSLDPEIPTEKALYSVPDFALYSINEEYGGDGVYTALGLNAVERFEPGSSSSMICGNITKKGMYFPAYRSRVKNWASIPPCPLDKCNVCFGENTACAGCDGVPNSKLVLDVCHVCGGDNTSCMGCDGVPHSRLTTDACGICGGDGSSCECCPGMIGEACDVQDKCYGVRCENNGVCDLLTGQCACSSRWTGQYCEAPRCSGNGISKTPQEDCKCYKGWTGRQCDACVESPFPGYTNLCVPLEEKASSGPSKANYVLWTVKNTKVAAYMDGRIGVPSKGGRSAIRPNSIGYDGVRRDCRCRSEPDIQKQERAKQVDMDRKYLDAKRLKQHLDREIEKKNVHLKRVVDTMLDVRYEKDGGLEYVRNVLETRDHSESEAFFVDLLEEILAEIQLTQDESEIFSEFYEECVEEHFDDDDGGVNFQAAFYILLPLSVVFSLSTVVLLFLLLTATLSNHQLRKSLG